MEKDILKCNSLPNELWELIKPIKLKVDILCNVDDINTTKVFIKRNLLESNNKAATRYNRTLGLLRAKVIAEYLEEKGTTSKVKSEINMVVDLSSILMWGVILIDDKTIPEFFSEEIKVFYQGFKDLEFKYI